MDIGDNGLRVYFVVRRLLERLPKETRMGVLEPVLQMTRSFATAADIVVCLGREHGRHCEDRAQAVADGLIDAIDLDRLEHLAASKIGEAAEDGRLLQAPKLAELLYNWIALSGKDTVNDRLAAIVKTDEARILIARAFTLSSFVDSGGNAVSTEVHIVRRRNIEDYFDADEFIAHILALAEADAAPEEWREVARRFMTGLENEKRRR